MAQKALIVEGGWKGHDPRKIAEKFHDVLQEEGFHVEISNTLDVFLDDKKLKSMHLIIPVWTMGKITGDQCQCVLEAVAAGTGLAGCHGGMCDAFRENVDWHFLTGGQWVAHPGGDSVEYMVNIKCGSSSIVEGIEDFKVKSEQYYLHVDPAVEVLATTTFPTIDGPHSANGKVDVPVVWTKRWGKGRVFYCSIGHNADTISGTFSMLIMKRGFLWAAAGK